MMTATDALNNNLGELDELKKRKAEVEKHLARERQKLAETDDPEIQQEIRDRIRKIEDDLTDINIERQGRLEAASMNVEALRSQFSRFKDAVRRMLYEDKTLAERIRTHFREQGISIVSILTAIRITISTLVLALTGGGGEWCRRRLPVHPTRAGSRSG